MTTQDDDDQQLKPCPFCGGKAEIVLIFGFVK